MRKLKYVIFDCDGVLVESEILANRIEAELKTELGFPTTPEEQIRRFVGFGNNHPVMIEELRKLPPDYLTRAQARIKEACETELLAVDGIHETLEKLGLPRCVASSSELESIEHKLSLVGLRSHFPALFSGHMVAQGKPEPDLFLHAAHSMNWDPAKCLVIEDSEPGVRAAKAAGMTVCGFVGGQHISPGHAERLLALGAEMVIADMRNLLFIAGH